MEKFKLPPIPIGFKVYENPQGGLFIRNIIDNRIFKWISTCNLEANGLDRIWTLFLRIFLFFNSLSFFFCSISILL